jgi:hypothetical protein
MKIKTARIILSLTWLIGGLPLLAIVPFQSISDAYGETSTSWDKGYLWLMPLLFPPLSMIVGSWLVGKNNIDEEPISSVWLLVLTLLLSATFLFIIWGAIFVGAFKYNHQNWDQIFRSTTLYLSVGLQPIVTVALTKFFIENISSRHDRD